MGDMKLSLHPDWWGYGYTDEFATARGLDPQNRHLSRFNPRLREVATGWARAAVVVSPSTYFAPGLAVHPSKPVQLYTAPTPPLHREWHLFIGEPGIPAPALTGAIDVGRMSFRSGRTLWIVGADVRLNLNTEQLLNRTVEQSYRHPGPPDHRMMIASGDRDGEPFFVELADARRDRAPDGDCSADV